MWSLLTCRQRQSLRLIGRRPADQQARQSFLQPIPWGRPWPGRMSRLSGDEFRTSNRRLVLRAHDRRLSRAKRQPGVGTATRIDEGGRPRRGHRAVRRSWTCSRASLIAWPRHCARWAGDSSWCFLASSSGRPTTSSAVRRRRPSRGRPPSCRAGGAGWSGRRAGPVARQLFEHGEEGGDVAVLEAVDLPARGASGRSLTQRRRTLKLQLKRCREAAWYRQLTLDT